MRLRIVELSVKRSIKRKRLIILSVYYLFIDTSALILIYIYI